VQSSALAPGSFFANDYQIEKPLGQGGMGTVYVALQVSTGKRRALKLMSPTVADDPSYRERFAQEARVGAMIASEHVVEVIGAGVDRPSGLSWLAMELLDGEDLAAHVARRGALSPGEVREIFAQVSHGIAAAHAISIVHRDLKPANVFLARTRRQGARFVVKILDFGIAKIVAPDVSATKTVGTPLWMAPEQTTEGGRVSPATDVWALGLIAYFLLTGRVYWRSTGAMELLREIVLEPLVPASSRAETPLPAGFDAWFARCVTREPAARFADAAEAWRALERILGGGAEITALAPPSKASPLSSTDAVPSVTPSRAPTAPVRSRRGVLVASAVLACVVIAIAAIVTVRALSAKPPLITAQTPSAFVPRFDPRCECREWAKASWTWSHDGHAVCNSGLECAAHFGLRGNECVDVGGYGRPWCYVAPDCPDNQGTPGGHSWRWCDVPPPSATP
jgi:serine/threonine protein kinase